MSNISDLLWEAATLMLTGMTFVFVFLSVLVVLVQCLARWLPKDAPEVNQPINQTVPKTIGGESPDVIAAISAAIKVHRAKNA
ncbi:oxaloacetate decarboxylase subunit gamma [Thaumasiovibrio sp. DFM-14]|uniref:oxaloacetate decarboxylase subunit gamma n=1 Tax=Thaumasiovibrio sp. DFM-14 TaxID=3384792 RepID=UPI0039A12D96